MDTNGDTKMLLLKDLSSRLPYKVIIQSVGENKCLGLMDLVDIDSLPKPYLRPLSSMTDEEKEELKTLFDAEEVTSDSICYIEGGTLEEYLSRISFSFCSKIIDWLNAHHFDFRKLIERGLAIDCTGLNIY